MSFGNLDCNIGRWVDGVVKNEVLIVDSERVMLGLVVFGMIFVPKVGERRRTKIRIIF